MENMVVIKEEELRSLITKKFESVGYPSEQAQEMSNHLVYADAIGLGSHGSLRVRYNAMKLESKGINLNPSYELVENSACSAIFDAQNSNGLYAVNKAVEYGIAKVKEKGIYIINIKNITHSGSMSYYIRKIAKENLIGITMCNAQAQVLPTNAKKPYFGTNPIAYAVPTEGEPIIFDMATSVQAMGKVFLASLNNEKIPDHWAVDENGNPTTDPNEAVYALPIAGPKGYGLGMLVDILCAALVNAPFGLDIKTFDESMAIESELSQFLILIDPAIYSDINDFLARMSKMVAEIHDLEPYDVNKPVLVPGESSKARYEKHLKNGIPISKKVYEYLTE